MSEAPPELAAFLIEHAKSAGMELIRYEVVELVCRIDGVPEQGFVINWSEGAGLHILVPKEQVVGRA